MEFSLREQYTVFVNITYLDDEGTCRGREYFGGVFLDYPVRKQIEVIIQKFINDKKSGKINAESINYARIEKRYQIYDDKEINILNDIMID